MAYLILIVAIAIRTMTDILFKCVVHYLNFDEVSTLWRNVLRVVFNPLTWIAAGSAFLNFWLWCLVLKHFDLSYAYPLFSICYVFIILFGKVFFGEHLDKYKLVGLFFIGVGSALLFLR